MLRVGAALSFQFIRSAARRDRVRHRSGTHFGRPTINVLATALLNAHRQLIFERTAVLRLPAIYQFPGNMERVSSVTAHVLLKSIGKSLGRLSRFCRVQSSAIYQLEQPTTFELVINFKTAKALGLEVPARM